MRPKQMLVICCLFLLWAAPAQAIRFDWSQQERDCAASLGIRLGHSTDPKSSSFVKHLTWLSDSVVSGHVDRIQHDLTGPYHTIVWITVASSRKGSIPAGEEIQIVSVSGPIYTAEDGSISTLMSPGEAVFHVGDDVIVFLTADAPEYEGQPGKYALQTGQYLLIDDALFLITREGVVLEPQENINYSLQSISGEIENTVKAQKTLCQ